LLRVLGPKARVGVPEFTGPFEITTVSLDGSPGLL
jgi:hypothetical protein